MYLTEFLLSLKTFRPKAFLLGGLSILMTAGVAEAREVVFSYSNPDDGVAFVGTSKAEPYDVAIMLADPGLKGAKIVGMEVPLNLIPNITDLSAWISTELKLETDEETGRKKNAPNVCSKEATAIGGLLVARFDTPYELGDAPAYVGYSFRIPEVGKEENDPARYPVAVSVGVEPGALMMHTQRHYLKWGDRGEALGGKSAIKVVLDGDFPAVNASIEGVQEVKWQGDNPTIVLPLYIRSYGSDPIESLRLAYTYQGKKSTVDVKFDEPLQPLFGQPTAISVEIPNVYGLSTEPIEMSLEQINGVDNPNPARDTSFSLSLLRLFPKKRPLVEEYTGLWCGWCPRGYVGMETMSATEPDFIGVAFHNSDPMAVTDSYPSKAAGFPSCYIDRVGTAKSPSPSSLRKYWGERANEYSPIEISVMAQRDAADPKNINVTSSFSFVEAPAHECRVAYMLLANGLTDESWVQKNYFSTKYEADMDMFYGAPGDYTGLIYNDVVAMYSPFTGEEGSVPAPAELEPYAKLQHEYVFRTEGSVSQEGYDLIGAAGDHLTVVAVMTDVVTGEVLNAAKAELGESGVETVATDLKNLRETVYLNLAGMTVSNPGKGIYIKVSCYTDGSRKAEKVILK